MLDKIPLLEILKFDTTRIRAIYSMLLGKLQDDLDQTEATWVDKLDNPDVDIDMSLLLSSQLLLSSNLKAQIYKTIYNLYYTPAKLYAWGKRLNDKCPRCGRGPATLIHMLYECNKLASFKRMLSEFWEEVFGHRVAESSTLYILGQDSSLDLSAEEESCLFIGTAVYRIILTARWKEADPPTFQMWLCRFLGVYNQEKAIYASRGRRARSRGARIWSPIDRWSESIMNV